MSSRPLLPVVMLPLLWPLSACSSLPGLDEPEITLRPVYALPVIKGKVRLQSPAAGGGVVDNSFIPASGFGAGGRDEDLGISASLGDGFSGIDLAYMKYDIKHGAAGILPDEWGILPAGSEVKLKLFMDEWRLRYTAQLFEYETENEVAFKLGAGAMLAHRDLKWKVRTSNDVLSQNIKASGDTPYLTARAAASWREFGARADFAYNKDVKWGGEFEGVMQDLELVATYTLTDQDLTLFAGYRRTEMPASGSQDGLAWDGEFILDGYILGLEFKF